MLQVCAVDFTALHLLRPLMIACREHGWTVEFACADGSGTRALRAEGFGYHAFPATRGLNPVRHALSIAKLTSVLRDRRPQLVHTHTPVGGLIGRTATIIAPGSRTVHTFHGLPFETVARTLRERGFLAVERRLAARTDLFFSQAAGDADRAVDLGIARRGDLIVIGNGVDVQIFAPDEEVRSEMRAELGIPSNAVVIVTVARLVREKGVLDLAEAAAALKADDRIYFLIVGDALPSDRTSVAHELKRHRATAELGHRWRSLGYRRDITRLLQAADIFVLPTYREGLPRSVIEAMAVGLPAVATNIPACRELVEPGRTGLLVPPGDIASLTAALASLADSAELRAQMGARARERALAAHDERRVVGLQIDAMERLLRR